jgi:uncharacterized protein YkwD
MKSLTKVFVTVAAMFVILSMLPAQGISSNGTKKTFFGASASSASGDNNCYHWKSAERGFARKLNNARVGNSLHRLKLDPEVSKAAKKHTYEMVSRNTLEHTTSAHLRKRVTNWTILGENVGVGNTVSSLHSAFMASPAHRDNIMLPAFTNVGISTLHRNGRLWVTVIFESVSNPGTTLRMPRCR